MLAGGYEDHQSEPGYCDWRQFLVRGTRGAPTADGCGCASEVRRAGSVAEIRHRQGWGRRCDRDLALSPRSRRIITGRIALFSARARLDDRVELFSGGTRAAQFGEWY